jgi:hypothetical protein
MQGRFFYGKKPGSFLCVSAVKCICNFDKTFGFFSLYIIELPLYVIGL